ncbi:hypothetical protein GCM10027440_36500 [Nocardiopsis coralliicola]
MPDRVPGGADRRGDRRPPRFTGPRTGRRDGMQRPAPDPADRDAAGLPGAGAAGRTGAFARRQDRGEQGFHTSGAPRGTCAAGAFARCAGHSGSGGRPDPERPRCARFHGEEGN